MSHQVTRISLVPLHNWHYELKQSLPFDLGSGFAVRDLSSLISLTDMSLWDRYIALEQREELEKVSVCLVHEYNSTPEIGADERESERLLGYIAAHLRFLAPNKTNAEYTLKGTLKSNVLEPFNFSPDPYPLFLEDCEILRSEIGLQHLRTLKKWMPWIVQFRKSWRDYYPLLLSLYFSEKAYREETIEVRHLLRVMALEALLSSEKRHGMQALRDRLGMLFGTDTDLYAQYRSALQPDLPELVFGKVIRDVCRLRNKVAHGDKLPPQWLKRDRRRGERGGSDSLTYADELREAATSMVSLAWKKILDNGLQSTFADKAKMETHFSVAKS